MTDMPENTPLLNTDEITELEINQDYKDHVFDIIKSSVRGNKCNPDDVKLKIFEGKILRFSAYTLSTLITKRTKTLKSGRVETAQKIDNEEAANIEMDRAYKALNADVNLEHNVRRIILNRKDKGFGVHINNISIPLLALKKDFVIYEACATCRAKGTVECIACSGTGRVTCTRCKGTGRILCTHCKGARMVPMAGNASKKIPCPVCNGQGFANCPVCNNTRSIPCKVCNSKGYTTCPTCQGTCWNSRLFTQEIEANTSFYYPKNKLPERVTKSIEKYNSEITEHATIRIITDDNSIVQWKELQSKSPENNPYSETTKHGQICIPVIYDVSLPYGHIEYTINEKNYSAFLFGKKATPTDVSPFLDDLIAEGITKLKNAAKLRGDVHTNLKAASEYRIIKEGIIFATTSPLKKAKHKLKKANPLGLSNNAINTIINAADRAIKNITQKPRIIGSIIVGVGYFALFAGYFLSPLRHLITDNISNTISHGLIDIAVLGTAIYIGMIGIQAGAQSALNKTMNMFVSNKIKTTQPKLGKVIYWNTTTACIAFLTIIEISRHIPSIPTPSWYETLLNMF